MIRKYTDFCLAPSVIGNGDDYMYELEFFLVKVRRKEELDSVRVAASRWKVQWGVRAAAPGMSGDAKERQTEWGTEVSIGKEKVLRPTIGITPARDTWLEFTPALLASAMRTPNGYRWLKKVLNENTDRTVLGSDTPTPPSAKDVIALVAWLVGVPEAVGDALIRRNSSKLRQAIATCE